MAVVVGATVDRGAGTKTTSPRARKVHRSFRRLPYSTMRIQMVTRSEYMMND